MFKNKVLIFVMAFLSLFLPAIVFAAAGDLDTTFNSPNGYTLYNGAANGYDSASAVAVQADGKVVVAGYANNGSNFDVSVLRYNADGTLDNSFGSGDIVKYNGPANSDDYGFAAAIQSDGKIVVVGQSWNAGVSEVLVLRYNSNGTLDSAFGNDGTVTFTGTNGYDSGYAVFVQPDGKLVIAGVTLIGGHGFDVLVLRYNGDGTRDAGFGNGGAVTYNDAANSSDAGYAVAVQADGKIVVAGTASNGTNDDVLVLRYNHDGTLDAGFGNSGAVIYNGATNNHDSGNGVTIQADGKIVVAGKTRNFADNEDLLVMRLNNDGTPDSFFGANGVVTYIGTSASWESAAALNIQPDGKIVTAGSGTGGGNDVLVLRLNIDGSLDTSFGVQGAILFDGPAHANDTGYAITVQPDGKIIAAGTSYTGTSFDALVLRLMGDNGTQNNADGTYSYDSGSGTLTINIVSSNFTCDGPTLGIHDETVSSFTATSMTWTYPDGGSTTWTRARGTTGDITGTWTSHSSSTGNTFYLTLNTDGTAYVTGYIVQCSGTGGSSCATVVSSGSTQQSSPSMNSLGEVVWAQYDSGSSQIYSSTRGQLTFDSNYHNSPSINKFGDVVWEQNGNIYGLMSGVVSQLTWSGGYVPSINDHGEVVYINSGQVYSTIRGQLTFDGNWHDRARINNNGDVVWAQSDSTGYSQIYKLASGSSVPVAVTTDPVMHESPSINDSGEIVWSQGDYYNMKIYSSTRGQLTSSCPVGSHQEPFLSNCGDVVFTVFNQSTYSSVIYRLDSGVPCQITYDIMVTKTGSGNGTITSNPAGLNLTTALSGTASFAQGTQVTLTATPDANNIFTGWSGACTGAGSCVVTMDGMKNVTASFTGPATGVTITPDIASPRMVGDNINITAAGIGGSGSYEYKFLLNNGAGYTIVQNYSTSNTWTWNTTGFNAGPYSIMVYVRNAGSTASYQAYITTGYTLSLSTPTITTNIATPQAVGANITFTATEVGGGNYEYKFLMSTGGPYATVQNYSTSGTWTWNTTGLNAGAYSIMVYVRNVGSTASYQAYGTVGYTLSLSQPTLIPSITSPQLVGQSITFTAIEAGGGNYEYKFLLKSGTGPYVVIQDYSASNSYTWVGSAPGTYSIMVYVRSVGSTSSYQTYSFIPSYTLY